MYIIRMKSGLEVLSRVSGYTSGTEKFIGMSNENKRWS
jgi:hypothetical protein